MSTATDPAVRAALARRARLRRRLIHYGQWDPWRDAEPVRDYVRKLMSEGLSAPRIAAGSGVTLPVIQSLLYGNTGQPPTTRMRTDNAERIMSYRPSMDDYPPDAVCDATGSRRRLQALATLGWTRPALAARAGIHPVRLTVIMQRGQTTTSVATARIVRDLYDELWSRSPAEDEVPSWIVKRTRGHATRSNWAGPLAWEDDNIDNPKAKPRRGRTDDSGAVDMAAVMRRLEGEPIDLTAWERTAAIEYGLRTRGLPYEAVAELLDMELESVKRSWERAKSRARAEGATWPDAPRWTDPMLNRPTDVQRSA
jgi:hypothetical protein